MAKSFGTSTSVLGMSVGIFLTARAFFQILIGLMIDNYGHRPVVLWSLSIFIIAILLVPISAVDTKLFSILRKLPATAAACILTSRAIMRDITDTREANSARMAYVTIGMAVAPLNAQSLGGTSNGFYGWQANFYLIAGMAFIVLGSCYFDQAKTLQKK